MSILADMPRSWRLVSTRAGRRTVQGLGWTAYHDADGWELSGPPRGLAAGPRGRTALAPWAGGCEAVAAAYDARLAAEREAREARRINALTAYLALCDGSATVAIHGAADDWETDDDDAWGGAAPSAGTYGGTGWRLEVVRDGVAIYTIRADRRAELAAWEQVQPTYTIETYSVPREAWPADLTPWTHVPIPAGWRLVTRRMGSRLVRG